MKSQKRELATKTPSHQLTEPELAAVRRYAKMICEATPRLKISDDGGTTKISPDHPHETVGYALLAPALGTTELDFIQGLIGQLVTASSGDGRPDEAGVNFMLAVIKDIKPKDQIDAMFAAQIAAVHRATMMHSGLLTSTTTPQQHDIYTNGFNKLARTFATLVEGLDRRRTGGEQAVMVQNVSVNEGGQAIVGNVTQALPKPANAESSTPALTDARQPAMPIIEGSKRERVPLRRRQKNDDKTSS
jgi:hypothetical protein